MKFIRLTEITQSVKQEHRGTITACAYRCQAETISYFYRFFCFIFYLFSYIFIFRNSFFIMAKTDPSR